MNRRTRWPHPQEEPRSRRNWALLVFLVTMGIVLGMALAQWVWLVVHQTRHPTGSVDLRADGTWGVSEPSPIFVSGTAYAWPSEPVHFSQGIAPSLTVWADETPEIQTDSLLFQDGYAPWIELIGKDRAIIYLPAGQVELNHAARSVEYRGDVPQDDGDRRVWRAIAGGSD